MVGVALGVNADFFEKDSPTRQVIKRRERNKTEHNLSPNSVPIPNLHQVSQQGGVQGDEDQGYHQENSELQLDSAILITPEGTPHQHEANQQTENGGRQRGIQVPYTH